MPPEYLLENISHGTLCLLMSSFMADIRIRIRIRFRAFLKTEKKTTEKSRQTTAGLGQNKKKKERNPMSVCGFWSIGCSYTPESQDCGPFYLLCPSRFFMAHCRILWVLSCSLVRVSFRLVI